MKIRRISQCMHTPVKKIDSISGIIELVSQKHNSAPTGAGSRVIDYNHEIFF